MAGTKKAHPDKPDELSYECFYNTLQIRLIFLPFLRELELAPCYPHNRLPRLHWAKPSAFLDKVSHLGGKMKKN